jgi:hypothetical protein
VNDKFATRDGELGADHVAVGTTVSSSTEFAEVLIADAGALLPAESEIDNALNVSDTFEPLGQPETGIV